MILELTVSPTGDVTAITRLRIIPPFTDLVTGAVSPTRGPAPFVLHLLAGNRAVWHMPRRDPPMIYLTYDDGPNPATTPNLLDVLARESMRHSSSSIVI